MLNQSNSLTAPVIPNSTTTATDLAGGSANALPYQSSSGITTFLSQGTGVLQETAGAPIWTTTPTLTGTNFSAIPNGALSHSSTTIGTTAISLGSSSTTLAGLTSVNNVTITAPVSTATLTLGSGKTFTVNNSLTLSGTDSTTMTFPTTSATIARTDAAQTFTGAQTFGSSAFVTTAMGIGNNASVNASVLLDISGNTLSGTTQYGLFVSPLGRSDGTVALYGASIGVVTQAASYNVTTIAGLEVSNATLGAGSSATTAMGLMIQDQTTGTTNYGIQTQVTSGTSKWNIYASGTANNAFLGNVAIGSTTAPAVALAVTGAGTLTTSLTVGTSFGCNGKTAQTSYASGGQVVTTAPSLASYGFTQAQAAAILTLINNMQAALVANGIMS